MNDDLTRRDAPLDADVTHRDTPVAPDLTRRDAPLDADATRRDAPVVPDMTRRDSAAQPSAPLTVVLPAELLAEYRVLEQLPTRGGEADAFRVQDQAGQMALLKLYRSGIEPNPLVLEKLKGANPSHVARLLRYGQAQDGRWYEVQEFIPHGDLKSFLQQHAPLTEAQAWHVFQSLFAAIGHVNGMQILHRDLKPENVMVRQHSPLEVVLVDFGVSNTNQFSMALTHGGFKGTLHYAAPEFLTSGMASQVMDLWPLGLMLLEMLTGKQPLAGLEENVVRSTLSNQSTALPVKVNPNSAWYPLLRGLLQKSYRHRWDHQTVQAFVAAHSIQGGKLIQVQADWVAPKEVAGFFTTPYRLQVAEGKTLEAAELQSLSQLLMDHPEKAMADLGRRRLSNFLEMSRGDNPHLDRLASQVAEIEEEVEKNNTYSGKSALLRVLALLSPDGEDFHWGSIRLDLQEGGLLALTEQTLKEVQGMVQAFEMHQANPSGRTAPVYTVSEEMELLLVFLNLNIAGTFRAGTPLHDVHQRYQGVWASFQQAVQDIQVHTGTIDRYRNIHASPKSPGVKTLLTPNQLEALFAFQLRLTVLQFAVLSLRHPGTRAKLQPSLADRFTWYGEIQPSNVLEDGKVIAKNLLSGNVERLFARRQKGRFEEHVASLAITPEERKQVVFDGERLLLCASSPEATRKLFDDADEVVKLYSPTSPWLELFAFTHLEGTEAIIHKMVIVAAKRVLLRQYRQYMEARLSGIVHAAVEEHNHAGMKYFGRKGYYDQPLNFDFAEIWTNLNVSDDIKSLHPMRNEIENAKLIKCRYIISKYSSRIKWVEDTSRNLDDIAVIALTNLQFLMASTVMRQNKSKLFDRLTTIHVIFVFLGIFWPTGLVYYYYFIVHNPTIYTNILILAYLVVLYRNSLSSPIVGLILSCVYHVWCFFVMMGLFIRHENITEWSILFCIFPVVYFFVIEGSREKKVKARR